MTIEEARNNVGRSVVYKPYKDCDETDFEYGTITSVSDAGFVYVQYDTDTHSKGTWTDDLEVAK